MPERRSQAWAALERDAARALGGRRVVRPWSLFETRVDCEVPDFERLQVDCKYRATFKHHSMLAEIKTKYCQDPGDVPIMVSRARGGEALAVMPLDFLGDLLSAVRRLREVAST